MLRNQNENYEIEDKLYIFEFLGKILVYPDDNQLISDFNLFLDSKKMINYSMNYDVIYSKIKKPPNNLFSIGWFKKRIEIEQTIY